MYKKKVNAKIINVIKNAYIFWHSNDCETPYIDIEIYIDFL